MFRKFFSATALVSVVAAGLSFSVRTQACGEPMPQTLLWLYKNSSEIHLATYSRSVDVGVATDEDDYSRVSVRLFFDISSTLKGESKKSFAVDRVEYRSKRAAEVEKAAEPEPDADEAEETDEAAAGDEPSEDHVDKAEDEGMQPGSPVLLFLSEKGEEDEFEDEGEESETKKARVGEKDENPELVLASQRDGIRWIASADIGVYERRIKELNSIYSGDAKGRQEELIDWMIRCMEHSATRWDGAFELNMSFASLDRIEAAEEYEGDDEGKPWVASSDNEEAAYARLVTRSQMDRMSNILMSPGDAIKKGALSGIPDGEAELIGLVERWARPDVAKFLLHRLRDGRLEAYESHRLMNSIASMLEDDELTKAVEEYGEILWEDGDEIYEADVDEEEGEDVEAEVSTDGSNEAPAKVTGKTADIESAESNDDQPEKRRRTVKEVRAERLAAFIALVDSVLAKPEVQLEIAIRADAAGRQR